MAFYTPFRLQDKKLKEKENIRSKTKRNISCMDRTLKKLFKKFDSARRTKCEHAPKYVKASYFSSFFISFIPPMIPFSFFFAPYQSYFLCLNYSGIVCFLVFGIVLVIAFNVHICFISDFKCEKKMEKRKRVWEKATFYVLPSRQDRVTTCLKYRLGRQCSYAIL